jgi:hypothetical protein
MSAPERGRIPLSVISDKERPFWNTSLLTVSRIIIWTIQKGFIIRTKFSEKNVYAHRLDLENGLAMQKSYSSRRPNYVRK